MQEAPTIVLVGAGSTSFGLSTLHDLYADPVFTGSTIWLVDVAAPPIERMQQLAGALEHATQRGITVRAATDRADALPGADAVVVSVEVDRDSRWEQDFEIPRSAGRRSSETWLTTSRTRSSRVTVTSTDSGSGKRVSRCARFSAPRSPVCPSRSRRRSCRTTTSFPRCPATARSK